MNKIKILVIEGNEVNNQLISETLSKADYIEVVGSTVDQEEAKSILQKNQPNIVLLGSSLDFDRYMFAYLIANDHKSSATILIENELKEDTMSKAMFLGAKDVILAPFNSMMLLDSINRANQLIRAQSYFPTESSPTLTSPPPAQAPKNVQQTITNKEAKFITLFSTKGGVGTTFLAANLAAELARKSEDRVCLVDLDLDFGNAALSIDVMPNFTISDIVDDFLNIDQSLIESYLVEHKAGFKVLAANARPLTNEYITDEHIEKILEILKKSFDYIVLDMPARFYEPVNPAFQITDLLLIITSPEIATVRNTKAAINVLSELNFPKQKIKLVLNKHDKRSLIKPKDVERTIEHSLYHVINADYKYASLSLNTGVPIVISRKRKAISKQIRKLSKKIKAELN